MLIGQKICLGPILQPDAAAIFKWRNSVGLMHMNGQYLPFSQRSFEEWFNLIGKDPSSVVFAIRKQGNLDLLGYVQIGEIHPLFHTAIIGIIIGEAVNRGKGYGEEALRLCVDFCWKELNLQRLSLLIAGENEIAVRAYTKAGFEKEGTLRRAIYTNGAYVDGTLMGLLRPMP